MATTKVSLQDFLSMFSGGKGYVDGKEIKKIYFGNTDFTTPTLTANGSLGGSAFAVYSSNVHSSTYDAFNVFSLGESQFYSSDANPSSGTIYFTIYNPVALKVSQIAFTNVPSGFTSSSPKEIEIQGSDDNSTWTTLTSYTNTNNTVGSTWTVDISGGYYKYYRIAIKSANTSEAYVNIGKIAIIASLITGVAEKLCNIYAGNENGKSKKIYSALEIVSWATGTDEQIVAMVEAADRGEINLADYWSVGDERQVKLSAMSATGVGESHAAQTVTLVLMNKGGKTLASPTANGRTECSFVVGQKNILVSGSADETGYMNSDMTNSGGWHGCARRTWCNNVYYNAIPATLRPIFKQHLNVTANGVGHSAVTSTDYFAFAAEKEVCGSNSQASETVEANLKQFEYYKTTANIIKYGRYSARQRWWLRSPTYSSSEKFAEIYLYGEQSSAYAHITSGGIVPHGVI